MQVIIIEAATRGALWKKLFLEISQNSQENTCARASFFIKSFFFIKKETLAEVFSCEFYGISEKTFFTEHLWTTVSVIKNNILRSGENFPENLSASTILIELLRAIGSFSNLIMIMLCVVAIWGRRRRSLIKKIRTNKEINNQNKFPVDTGRKLNVHKTFSMYVQLTSCVCGVMTFQ